MYIILLLFIIKLYNSSFVSVLHVPTPSSLGSNILLNIFLSLINNFRSTFSFSTPVLQACVITGKPGMVNGRTYEINIRVICLV